MRHEQLGSRPVAPASRRGLAAALAELQRRPYDVVLMDVQTPVMDGLEATRQVRASIPPHLQRRIMAMTASAMKEDREECLAAGMDDYIGKPIRVSEPVAALDKVRPVAVAGNPPSQVSASASRDMEGAERPAAPPVLDPAALEKLRSNLGKRPRR